MLRNIGLKNFKAFENESFEIKPITVFLGPNNSGKSSVLASTRMLSQTLQSYDVSVPLLLNGSLGDFGTYKDVVFKNSKRRYIEIEFTLAPDEDPYIDEDESELWRSDSPLTMRIKYKFRPSVKEVVIKELEVFKDSNSIFMCSYNDSKEAQIIDSVNGAAVPTEVKSELSRRLRLFHFLPRSVFIPRRDIKKYSAINKYVTDEIKEILRRLPRICDVAYRYFMEIEFIGAMRVPPSRSFLFSGERHKKVGVSGENAANIIAMDSLRKGKKSKKIKDKLVSWLNAAGIASDIKIVDLSDRHYELHIQNSSSKEYQNFADVGYGNSQVIPVLVAGYNLRENETLVVEEPEIHLHPNAQAELGDFFLDLYDRKVNSIVESHSEYMVVRLQQHVAAGLIDKEDIAFYYIHSDEGKKNIKKLTLDDNGVFEQEWPQGFFPHRLEEARKLARLRHQNKEK